MGTKLIILFICISTFLKAQDVSNGERKGLIKATGSLYKSNMLNGSISHFYLGGNSEYFFSHKYSFRGDIYLLIGETYNAGYSMKNTSLLSAGFNRNFSKGKWCPTIGFYTGVTNLHMVSLLQTFAPDFNHPTVQLIPHIGISAGVQYYFYTYFHFFAEARYVHQLNPFQPTLLDEISYTGGLGFQIPLLK
jgi:hypothetical protein